MTGVALFTVLIDENSHYQNESERYKHGTFETLNDAVSACKKIVDESLASAFTPGMSSEELFRSYRMFGEDPFVRCSEEPPVSFSAWDYAKERSAVMCESAI